MTTICAECKYHKFESDIWHGQFCTAIKHKKILNIVTGKMGYAEHNPHPFCRDINRGNCAMFAQKDQFIPLIPLLTRR